MKCKDEEYARDILDHTHELDVIKYLLSKYELHYGCMWDILRHNYDKSDIVRFMLIGNKHILRTNDIRRVYRHFYNSEYDYIKTSLTLELFKLYFDRIKDSYEGMTLIEHLMMIENSEILEYAIDNYDMSIEKAGASLIEVTKKNKISLARVIYTKYKASLTRKTIANIIELVKETNMISMGEFLAVFTS
jgi:hypothetical protein